jgi:hypothetical protein
VWIIQPFPLLCGQAAKEPQDPFAVPPPFVAVAAIPADALYPSSDMLGQLINEESANELHEELEEEVGEHSSVSWRLDSSLKRGEKAVPELRSAQANLFPSFQLKFSRLS